MSEYYGVIHSELSLAHHGIKGQKWGVRRFQNKDGSLTSAGKKRPSYEEKLENKISAEQRRLTQKRGKKVSRKDAAAIALKKEQNEQTKKATRRAFLELSPAVAGFATTMATGSPAPYIIGIGLTAGANIADAIITQNKALKISDMYAEYNIDENARRVVNV